GAGPSEFALSIGVTATPDSLTMDGGSQSSIVVTTRDPNGKPISGVTLRLNTEIPGVVADVGALSARTIVTGSDGKASAVFTAPSSSLLTGPLSGGSGTVVSILVTTIGNNFQTAQTQRVDIRLSPPGVIPPPPGAPTAKFSWTPTTVNLNVPVTFDATESKLGQNATQITSYVWDFGDGAIGANVKAIHTFTT